MTIKIYKIPFDSFRNCGIVPRDAVEGAAVTFCKDRNASEVIFQGRENESITFTNRKNDFRRIRKRQDPDVYGSVNESVDNVGSTMVSQIVGICNLYIDKNGDK